VRLGDGTEESRKRIIAGLEWMWRFADELFAVDATVEELVARGIAVDPRPLRAEWEARIAETFAEAAIEAPKPRRGASGGRSGHHSEHLGHLLSEMQFLPRAYPGAVW
jgi:ring-1,2-phenylacetyl-CoA epoxidase subunit PaaC